MATKSLHTLNARDNVMLEFIQDYFKLTPEHMNREIQSLRRTAEDALSQKGISYDALKTALVPDRQRREHPSALGRIKLKAKLCANSNWLNREWNSKRAVNIPTANIKRIILGCV